MAGDRPRMMSTTGPIKEERRILVSFETVPSSEWSPEPELIKHPLRNLHWKSANRSIRTIQSLSVNYKHFSTLPDKSPAKLLDRPYLHLLFVLSDDNEIYRATLRTQIREWLDAVQAKHQSQEWLIVHVSSGRSANSKFYQRKGSVLDKIRADFNTGKKDRCVQVAQYVTPDDPTAWADFTVKVKEGIISTFDSNVSLYEEDVKKADSQRQLEGWQYTTFFLQKEGLAECFESMGLMEDALVQYDELEASFFQTLKENNMSSFKRLGGLDPGDDTLPLLSTTSKPYSVLITSNIISIFDFRIYLFAKQGGMLAKLGRINEIAKRGAYFISTFARTLRENQTTLGPNFVESWTYSACLNVVDQCQHIAGTEPVEPIVLEGFLAIKGELLELARKQLDKIGMGAGHLPMVHPFSMSLNEVQQSVDRSSISSGSGENEMRPPVTRKELLDAIAKRETFDKMYIDLSNKAIQAYQGSHRKRCSLKLHASLAALEDHRERLTSAQKLYSHLPAHYVDLRWVKIESSLLTQCTRLQDKLDMSKERLLSTLALVRAGVEYGSQDWALEGPSEGIDTSKTEKEQKVDLAKKLMDDVYHLSSKLSKDFAAIAFPTFSMRLAGDRGANAADEDGVTVVLVIKSLLPCALNIDEVRLKFSTTDGEQVWFTSGGCSLAPGETNVTLFCPTAIRGRLGLELSQIRFSRIIFQYSHRPVSAQNLAPDPRNMPTSTKQPLIYFPLDHQALDVYTELPLAIHLDQSRQIIVCIATGRNQLVKVSMKLSIAIPELSLGYADARVIEGAASLSPIKTENVLLIENVAASSVLKVQLPIIGTLREATIELNVVAEYYTAKRPTARRTLRRSISYPIALPLAVNVQDFFRRDCLLSKFSVTSDGFNGIRLKSADLRGAEGFTVKACRRSDSDITTVLPLQTANFLFKIVQATVKKSQSGALRLTLTYCSIQEEVIMLVKSVVQSELAGSILELYAPWFLEVIPTEVAASTNLHSFGVNKHLRHLVFDKDDWEPRVKKHFDLPEALREALRIVKDSYAVLGRPDAPPPPALPWRTLTIPVELPYLSILNMVRILPSCTKTEVGQAIQITLSVRPVFTWTRTPIDTPLSLAYDVSAAFEDWLVSGRKKGEFKATDGQETTVELIVIPLRPGALFLPSVAIRPIPLSSSPSVNLTCETQHVNAAAIVEVFPLTTRTTYTILNSGGHTSMDHSML